MAKVGSEFSPCCLPALRTSCPSSSVCRELRRLPVRRHPCPRHRAKPGVLLFSSEFRLWGWLCEGGNGPFQSSAGRHGVLSAEGAKGHGRRTAAPSWFLCAFWAVACSVASFPVPGSCCSTASVGGGSQGPGLQRVRPPQRGLLRPGPVLLRPAPACPAAPAHTSGHARGQQISPVAPESSPWRELPRPSVPAGAPGRSFGWFLPGLRAGPDCWHSPLGRA